jgi:hypothetical protein
MDTRFARIDARRRSGKRPEFLPDFANGRAGRQVKLDENRRAIADAVK